ncbi:MAG: SpaH/EbpB family LPXTG-anchored major pilin [Acutalibacteraceae bacterium]
MKIKKLLPVVLAFVLVLTIIPITAFAAEKDLTEGATASITVSNAVNNDELKAYKIIDTAYNAATNNVTHAWNSDFAEYFAGTAYDTVERFSSLADNSDDLKALLAGLPEFIVAKSIEPVGVKTVTAGSATFADLAMGEYFIIPSSSTSVYQLMLQKVQPFNPANTDRYKIDDVTFAAKHKEVNITKAADKTSVTKGEKVTYTLTVDIPTYSEEALDKTFSVSDKMADGLTLDAGSIKLTIDGNDVSDTAYTLDTTATAEYTFKMSVDNSQYAANWIANGGKKLVITYTATLNDDDTTAVNVKERNTATFDYSFYPYTTNHNKKNASVDVNTFVIKIDKYQADNVNNKLNGATFELYRTATRAEIDAGKAVTIPHTETPGILLETLTTANGGVATFEKYEANGDKYDYYLVETKAPIGYNLLDSAQMVSFTDAEVATTDGVYTVQVANSSGIELPITGGIGTVIFTAIGITLMAGAVILFLVYRKKTKVSENK